MRRTRHYRVPTATISDLFTERNEVHARVKDGLPPEAKLVDCWVDQNIQCVSMLFEHPSFDEVPDSRPAPIHELGWVMLREDA